MALSSCGVIARIAVWPRLRRMERDRALAWLLVPHMFRETIRLKEADLESEERRVANFVGFIGEGRGSHACGSSARF